MGTYSRQGLEDTLTETSLTKTEIKYRCRELWAELQQLQNCIKNLQRSSSSKKGDNGVSLSTNTARLYKDVQLTSAIDTLQQNQVPSLPDSSMILSEMLIEELLSDVNQLQETEELLRSQRLMLDEEISRMNETKMELLKSLDCLDEMTKQATTAETLSASEVQKELQKENSELQSVRTNLLHHLKDFLEERYPVPTKDQVKHWCKKYNPGSAHLNVKLLSMHSIIEKLMAKRLDCPEDPYVKLNDSFWPPYVEMLLRSGIVLRHPEIGQRIALTPYDL